MALDLYILPCRKDPVHHHHPPPAEKPLRIQIEGPLVAIQRLFPEAEWQIDVFNQIFPQPAGPLLANLTFEKIYGRRARPEEIAGDLVVRDQYLGWVMEGIRPLNEIDYYGVTFDHLVPPDDENPEVLQINIIEIENDGGVYAASTLPFTVDPADYIGIKVLAVPRCCQKRKGTQDRGRVNDAVLDRESESRSREKATNGVGVDSESPAVHTTRAV
ncbi:hypothetical protein J3459_011436 [Metarhizium acridum]|uniref:Uncharacterized protein n=1 Tax=Metarhizium acridum (strain CQMa 102) TaxID=655827 RepID=E9DTN6_METAQ|nr:uncharacterized protein MAC_00874 [Metarhizium acridum CQMa 102]EFY93091.1 hypothetical protein MAC_00874 [Metarhizium acridum CQMa 102]KAG8415525.1 hypothetical protein J3458_009366 [Metarhizium acridum]KAG8418792.1 hypothetical protein J3459_012015 [Metarhizium acridum]KAG8420033.1 hypothetical protein J3459_011436 [Metarhizium acridum]